MEDDNADRFDLPFDPAAMDVACCRGEAPGTRHFNIPQRHVHHSPTGFEWGYGGSGPSDLALNVLALFVPCSQERIAPPANEEDSAAWEAYEAAAEGDDRVELRDGTYVAGAVWEHYHDFKQEIIAALPVEGGTIRGDEIRAWLRARGVEPGA